MSAPGPVLPFDYRRTLTEIEPEVMEAVRRVLHSGRLLLGAETEAFEHELATAVGAGFAVGTGSGTAALQVALTAVGVGPGDEVVTVANTCPPTASAIRLCGATPVFVDVRADNLQMDVGRVAAAMTERTRCVVPVHLWGHAVDVPALLDVVGDVPVVEDCAQAHGTLLDGRHVGTFGAAGCFSFYPTKNLGAYGDAGAVVTGDEGLARRMRRIRVYGFEGRMWSQELGGNHRIDEIHAAILRVKLPLLDRWVARRREIAAAYRAGVSAGGLRHPPLQECVVPSFHQYVVRCEDRAATTARLDAAGVRWSVHYRDPLNGMPAFAPPRGRTAPGGVPETERAASRILSLPVHEALRDDEVARVVAALKG